MDCRRSLLGLFAAGMLFGCNREQTRSPGAGPAPTPPSIGQVPSGKPEKEVALRNPKASTCVAFGTLRLNLANEPERTPLEKQQYYDDARKAFQQALTLNPKEMAAHRGLAQVYAGIGDHERTVATYRKALEVTPRDAGLWFELGMCHSRAKEWQAALDAMYKGVQLEPENRQYGHMYAYALARSGAHAEALAVFIRLDGEAKAHYNMARMHAHLEQTEQSRQHLRLALQKEPEFQLARDLLTRLDTPGVRAVQTVSFETPVVAETPPPK